jgi:uncharacterized protein YndB with AHSA1/START domain
MTTKNTLTLTTPSDREVRMTRVFDAPRRAVFKALTDPALVKRWLLGPPGWWMPVCEVDARVGGAYRYVWQRDDDSSRTMGMGGVYREIVPNEKIVATEKFDEAWYPGEAIATSVLTETDGKTTLTTTVLYASKEARDMVLKSGMERGVAASYDRLAELLPAQAA